MSMFPPRWGRPVQRLLVLELEILNGGKSLEIAMTGFRRHYKNLKVLSSTQGENSS
jgi:hypothetical protein